MDCKWQGKGARSGSIFMKKTDPLDSVRLIRRCSLLFIQGSDDWVIKERHAKKLYNAATTDKKKLEIVKGGLHAERLLQFHYDDMKKLIFDWFSKTLRS
jgi:fermentation-respiration switch protein FrsA (DUF1100 family)